MQVPIDFSQQLPEPLKQVHTPLVRTELEISTAYDLPDLAVEMQACLYELPLLIEWMNHGNTPLPKFPDYLTVRVDELAQLMAWCFEGGRRYGLIEALKIVDSVLEKHALELALSADPASRSMAIASQIDTGSSSTIEAPRKPPLSIAVSTFTAPPPSTLVRERVSKLLGELGFEPSADSGVFNDDEINTVVEALAQANAQPLPAEPKPQPASVNVEHYASDFQRHCRQMVAIERDAMEIMKS
jgi:hypothetical protein